MFEDTPKVYEGCRPRWQPDMWAAEREDNPWSVDDQVKSEQAHWKLSQEDAPAAPAPVDPPAEQDEDEDEDDEEDDER